MTERRHAVDAPGGRTIAVVEEGDPAGAPVVYHHSTPGCGELYRTWVEDARERGIRLIGYDRAGYGASDRHPGRSVADVAPDIAAVADALGLDRFLTWGMSGGGPHALACAALLGDRVAAAAVFASAAPADQPDLDFPAGMGEENVVEFAAAMEGEDKLRPMHEEWVAQMRAATPEDVADQLRTIISEPDRAVLTGELAEFLHRTFLAGNARGVGGWLDDDLAFTRAWGFDVADISIPLQLWQGAQDLMVPHAHGEWLAAHIPGVDARFSAEDGHLTLTERRLGEVHAWLLEHL
jgi:pimeloyl-ACP methyl ester carboxylesterase